MASQDCYNQNTEILQKHLGIVKREKLRMIPMFLPGLLVYDGAFYCNRDTRQEAGWREQMMSSILGMMNWKLKQL